MKLNIANLRQNAEHVVNGFSDVQRKVFEATSKDPWGPTTTILVDIADLTYSEVAFREIMQILWKRLKDLGKNWRNVYKALVVLEYIIKSGSKRVTEECKEKIDVIKVLQDFHSIGEREDLGPKVREKAKWLVNLLKDDRRLKDERAQGLKVKKIFLQKSFGFGTDSGLDTCPKYRKFKNDCENREQNGLSPDIEMARPQTALEEERQVKLALAMSKEEAEQRKEKITVWILLLLLAVITILFDWNTFMSYWIVLDIVCLIF